MEYLITFIAGGIICFLGQLLFANTKIGVVKFFYVMIILGVFFAPLGIMDKIWAWTGGGYNIYTLSAGEGMFGGMMNMFNGDPSAFLFLWLMLICAFLTANICAALKKMDK